MFQPSTAPPASALTHRQSSQPNYPMHHPNPFLLTITFKTPAQSPRGSVSSCIISTFGIFIMLRTRSPTKGQFILKANAASEAAISSRQQLCQHSLQAGRRVLLNPTASTMPCAGARGQGRNNSLSSTDNLIPHHLNGLFSPYQYKP